MTVIRDVYDTYNDWAVLFIILTIMIGIIGICITFADFQKKVKVICLLIAIVLLSMACIFAQAPDKYIQILADSNLNLETMISDGWEFKEQDGRAITFAMSYENFKNFQQSNAVN